MTSDVRVAALERWHSALGDASLQWDDVEVIARLDLQDLAVARQIIFAGRDAVLGHWDELQVVLKAASPAAPPVTPPATEDAPVEVQDPGSALSGAVASRYEAMVAWLDGSRSSGEDVDDVSLDDLATVAKADPKSKQGFKRFRESMRMRSDELLAVLAEARARDEAEPVEEPVVEATPLATPEPVGQVVDAPAVVVDDVVRSGPTDLVDFAHFAYRSSKDALPPPPLGVSFIATGEESLELSWLTTDEPGVAIYTVVTSNEYAPTASPTLGVPIVSTFSSSAVDADAFTTPVRHVAVWLSRGADEAAARASQPVLHATGWSALPVRSCHVREDEGTVIGSWQAINGVTRIDVLRIPASEVERIRHLDNQYLIPAAGVTNSGFTDDGALPGVEYEFRIYAVAAVSGDQESFSPYVARRVRMQAVVDPVTDLTQQSADDAGLTYDLSWTVPAIGVVEIYRSAKPFPSGLGAQMVDRDVLEREGITADMRLARPTTTDEARIVMGGVPMPQGWSRAYFTPVTVLNGTLCRVGASVSVVKPGVPSELRLIERVDEQFLTFAWPAGAPMVNIYRGAKGSDRIDPATEQPIHELSEDDYLKYGGAHLANPLPSEGCSVHVVGVSYVKGNAVFSRPAATQYDGLARVSYRVRQLEETKGRRAKGPTGRVVSVVSPVSPSNLKFVLVHNAQRLPLHPDDGQNIGNAEASLVAGVEKQILGPLPPLSPGFLRLFVTTKREFAHLIAVLDPAVSELRTG